MSFHPSSIRHSKLKSGTFAKQSASTTRLPSKPLFHPPNPLGLSVNAMSLKLPSLSRLKMHRGGDSINSKSLTDRTKSSVGFSDLAEKPTLAEFRLMRTIGTGSVATVRLAQSRRSSEFQVIKIMSKADILRMKQVEHVKSEKVLLSELRHPFLVTLHSSFQDRANLYLVLEFAAGGELFRLLRTRKCFSVAIARFYICELVSVISFLHQHLVAYRDLKPENVLLAADGHIKLTDFGFAKRLRDNEKTFTVCGTPEYMAPEVIQQQGHSFPCDWWCLGILLFEMACGHPPFTDKNPYALYQKILTSDVPLPKKLDPELKELLLLLLDKDPRTRVDELHLKSHAFFSSVDWSDVSQRALVPPHLPVVRSADDTSNFALYREAPLQRTTLCSSTEEFASF